MKISIAYFTSRIDPHFDWFCDSLCRQLSSEELAFIQVIAVDRHLWALTPEAGNTYWRRGDLILLTDPTWHVESRREKFAHAVKGRFDFIHLPVKPCVWQGPFRCTAKDWFSAASARNTAILAAKHDYFVGVDDLTVLMPGWANQVRHASSSGYCVCGAYWKQQNIVVGDGEVKSFTEYSNGRDSRWGRGSDAGIVRWHGSGLFGCSFGMPLQLLLQVNGYDEYCDGAGAEDYDLGIRAERNGAEFWYNRNMLTFESEEGHHTEPSLPRKAKRVAAERLPPGYEGNPMSDHVMLNRVLRENRTTTLGQWTDLVKAREEFQASQRVLIPTEPTTDWRDGQPLEEM